ncbi:MAG: MMPL family transporter [Gammaproteobacteria bacterium]|nr:MMPL family transporter [Gammaproteobacteria bacterium]
MPVASVVALLLRWPRAVLLFGALLAVLAALYSTRFSFDASAETLVVEGDANFAAYERITETFTGDDFLLITFAPHDGVLLSDANIEVFERLQTRIAATGGISSVFSLLDVPLLKSPPVPITELAAGLKTLRSDDVDHELAIEELRNSPLFRELLISGDGRSGAMRANMVPTPEIDAEPDPVQARKRYLAARDQTIADIRAIQTEFSEFGEVHIGGVPMIAADMIAFVKSDLVIFGGVVVLLIMLVLYLAFREIRWVLLPTATAGLAVLYTTGTLGAMQTAATVISSNFVSLLVIMTISLTIHLIVRYRELAATEDGPRGEALVLETFVSKFAPCFYTALTTIAAFGSLTVSDIPPVEDFGWMMCLGVALAFLTAFTIFPALLMLLERGEASAAEKPPARLINQLGHLAQHRAGRVCVVSLAVAVAAGVGISRLSLDNRFIDYFQDDTEIYQGMVYIDQHLGGTVPFEVVVSFPPFEEVLIEDDFFAEETDEFPDRYWFTRDKLDRLGALQKALEARAEVGKVLSVASLDELAREFTDGEPLSDFELVAVLSALPTDIKAELIDPYAAPTKGQMRLSGRVIESGPYFDRDALVAEVTDYATSELGFERDEIIVSGMLVLFNDMLQELFVSQRDTLAYVLLATLLMFLILLRSVKFALLGLIPNVLSAAAVVGFMGLAGISLDMMTTTIAAISIGIGVDFAIHYLHRYRSELAAGRTAKEAVGVCHANIGRALYLTGITIIIGFSVLMFSNFVPTIMFGLLVAVAMGLALIANLSLLPSLLVLTAREGGEEA